MGRVPISEWPVLFEFFFENMSEIFLRVNGLNEIKFQEVPVSTAHFTVSSKNGDADHYLFIFYSNFIGKFRQFSVMQKVEAAFSILNFVIIL